MAFQPVRREREGSLTDLAKVLKAMGIANSETQAMEKAKEVFYFSQKMVKDFEEKKANIVETYFGKNEGNQIEITREVEIKFDKKPERVIEPIEFENFKEKEVGEKEEMKERNLLTTINFDITTSDSLQINEQQKKTKENVVEDLSIIDEVEEEDNSYDTILDELEKNVVDSETEEIIIIEEDSKNENVELRNKPSPQEEKEEKQVERKQDIPQIDLGDIFNFSKRN